MTSLILPSLFISLFGLFNIFGIKQWLFVNQLVYIVIAFAAFFAVKKIGRNFFLFNSFTFYWLFILLLIITFVIGFEVKGSRRWIDLYFFNFQASEFFKVFFILYLSDFFVNAHKERDLLATFLMSIILVFIPTFIIFKQPDLGNAMVFLFIYCVMLLFSNIPKRYFVSLILISFVALPVGWNFLKSYQKERIVSFANPHIDPQGTAYNMTQSIVTTGSGKFFGKGLGLGTQSKLFFLPENHTDFAFASLVEQLGFVGGFAVLLLFGVMLFLIIRRLFTYFFQKDSDEQRNFLFLIGFLSYLIFQVFVNVGMNVGLLPITGIALPFVSYGGSSLVALMIGLALLP